MGTGEGATVAFGRGIKEKRGRGKEIQGNRGRWLEKRESVVGWVVEKRGELEKEGRAWIKEGFDFEKTRGQILTHARAASKEPVLLSTSGERAHGGWGAGSWFRWEGY